MDLRSLRYFVVVAEELHFRRAAERLHMTQPPLSRAIRHLETDLGTVLLNRSSTGVTLTASGTELYDQARLLLEHAEQLRTRVTAAAGTATITVGTLVDSVEEAGTRLAVAFRQHHPGVDVLIREADFTDPTTGLRAGLADVALTRTPFDDTGISTRTLRSDPVGVVLRAADPLAGGRPCAWATSTTASGASCPTERTRSGAPTGTAPHRPAGSGTAPSSAPSANACRPFSGTARSGSHPSPIQSPRGSPTFRSRTCRPASSSSPGTPPTAIRSSARSPKSPRPPTARTLPRTLQPDRRRPCLQLIDCVLAQPCRQGIHVENSTSVII